MSERTITQKALLRFKSAANEVAGLDCGAGSQARECAVYVDWSAGVASGAVIVETATSLAYGGTWAPLATVTFSGTAPKQDVVQVTGVHLALRTRISTVLAGGTVSTDYIAN